MSLIRIVASGLVASLVTLTAPVAAQSDDTIVVKLATESRLIPLYVAPIKASNSRFDEAYLSQLRSILHFDMGHNGATQSVKQTNALDQTARGALDLAAWKSNNVYYLVKVESQGETLAASVISVNNGTTQRVNNLTLTGDLSHDRRLVHQLADAVHLALFGKEGVASTRFLYTVKTRHGSDSSTWVSEVWEADYDGANARQVTHDNALCVTPAYVPPKPGYSSSGGFVYVSYKTGQPKIYLASLRDGKGRRFSYLPGNQLMPAVSIQRDKVTFISDVASRPDVFLQPFNPEVGAMGKPQQIFSSRYSTQGTPTFSPDGRKVAFVSNKDGSPRIYVMDIPRPGTNVKHLRPEVITRRNRENTAPAWSPDGSKIAYCAKIGGERQIWIYDHTSGDEFQLTQGPGNKENPTWAPDSLHLIFNSASSDRSELYLVNLNQPEAVKISSGTGEKRFPCWEPKVR